MYSYLDNYLERNSYEKLKFSKMNRTKDELLLECIRQFEHIEDILGCDRLSTTQSLIEEISRALTIPAVSCEALNEVDKTEEKESEKYPCNNCQGGGCPVCGGWGVIKD